MEIRPSSSKRRSIIQSAGSCPRISLISARCLPSRWRLRSVCIADRNTLCQPVEQTKLSHAVCSWLNSSRIRARSEGSRSTSSALSIPPSSTQGGRIVVKLVEPALYGYTSQVTSIPRERASSMSSSASVICPQLRLPAALR
ncbi:hypothetical protein D3C71_1663840 [compost metagenome]